MNETAYILDWPGRISQDDISKSTGNETQTIPPGGIGFVVTNCMMTAVDALAARLSG